MSQSPSREKEVLRVRPFLWIGLGLFLLIGAAMAASSWLTSRWAGRPSALESVSPPSEDSRWNRHAPQLQTDAVADLRRLREEQQASLNQTAWVDSSHRFAHIPIEEAMRLVSSERDFFPSHPLSPEAMRQGRAVSPTISPGP